MNIPDKTTGDQLTGAEFTEFKNELANQIIALGLTPASNSIQLKESIARAVASGASHTDGGSANAYSLEAKGAQAIVTAYQDGQSFTFKATNSNTGISTLAIAGLSAKAIKKDGFANDLASGDIVAGKIYSVYYDSGQDKFELINAPIAGFSSPNLLINQRFEINQEVFAGGALSAGVYGFDMWKAGSGGANISKSGDVITLTSGSIIQVLESPRLASKTVTVSALSSVGSITAKVAGQSAVALPATFTLTGGDTGNIEVEIIGTAVTFEGLKVEVGISTTAFEERSFIKELESCYRYFYKTFPYASPLGTITNTGCIRVNSTGAGAGDMCYHAEFNVTMASAPTVTTYNPTSGATGSWRQASNNEAMEVTEITTKSANMQSTTSIASHALFRGHFVADARL